MKLGGGLRIRRWEPLRFDLLAPPESGILDHDVTLPNGTVVHNSLRVIRNDKGSEIVFSLFKRPGMTDDEFHRDAALVREDLVRLKDILDHD